LGDGINELNRYSHGFLQVVSVRGNCDLLSDAPEEMTFNLGGQTVYLSHGHKWGVKSGLMRLFLRAKEAGATVALFGHSHRYTEEFYEGVFFLNPGALVDGSYAVLTLSLDTIKAEQFSLY
jgi:putative phosphoesterase